MTEVGKNIANDNAHKNGLANTSNAYSYGNDNNNYHGFNNGNSKCIER